MSDEPRVRSLRVLLWVLIAMIGLALVAAHQPDGRSEFEQAHLAVRTQSARLPSVRALPDLPPHSALPGAGVELDVQAHTLDVRLPRPPHAAPRTRDIAHHEYSRGPPRVA